MVQVEGTTKKFGRIAAQTAKQVILQKIREAERNSLYDEYADREGDLITGTVQSVNSNMLTLSLGRAEAIMPRNQQIPGERYKPHDNGFSGARAIDGPSPASAQPFDKTFIDLNGPALRVIDLGRMGGPAQGQLVAAPKPFTVTADRIGQVFSIALDDANPPNIYAAATSAYGLPIVVPDSDGDGRPDRARRGAPNAAFMPGLFGPITVDGGPGSIWKIHGVTGAVSLFANVVLAGVPNSGPALGGLAFDPASRQLFAADRDTGMIHRFSLDGADRGQFDHGIAGLSAAGFAPARFDPRKRLNPESPAFDSTAPATWAFAPPARRVFGLAARAGRLYYAVAAGLPVWSVAILPDGSFGADARIEAQLPPGPAPGTEISDITFDDEGRMLLAERGAPTGAYDFQALAQPGSSRDVAAAAEAPGRGRHAVPLGRRRRVCGGLSAGLPERQWRRRHRLRLRSRGHARARDLRRHRMGDRRAIANAGQPRHRAAAGIGRPVSGRRTAGSRGPAGAPAKCAAVQLLFHRLRRSDRPLGIERTSRRRRNLAGVPAGVAAAADRGGGRVSAGPVQCRWHLPIPARVSAGDRVRGRLLRVSRLPGELCAHPRPLRAAAAQLQFGRDLQRGTLRSAAMSGRPRRRQEADAAQSASADRRGRQAETVPTDSRWSTTNARRPATAAAAATCAALPPIANARTEPSRTRTAHARRPTAAARTWWRRRRQRRMRVRTRLSMDHRRRRTGACRCRSAIRLRGDAGCCLPGTHWNRDTYTCEPGSEGPRLSIEKKLREMLHIAHRRKTRFAASRSASPISELRPTPARSISKITIRTASRRVLAKLFPSGRARSRPDRQGSSGISRLLRARLEVHELRLARRAGAKQFRAAWPRSVLRERRCARGSAGVHRAGSAARRHAAAHHLAGLPRRPAAQQRRTLPDADDVVSVPDVPGRGHLLHARGDRHRHLRQAIARSLPA